MDKKLVEIFEELDRYSDKLIPAVEKTVKYFRSQREDQAINLLIPVIEGLQWTVEVAFKTKHILEDNGVTVQEGKVNDTLKELVDALENQDYVLIGDLLEYEILEMLRNWQKGVRKALEGAI